MSLILVLKHLDITLFLPVAGRRYHSLSVWSLHILPVPILCKNMHVKVLTDSNLDIGVTVSVNGCLSPCC